MPKKFEKGETVYFVQSAIYVKEAQVINDSGGFVTVKLPETVDSEPEKADFLRRRKRQNGRLAERQADKFKY